MTDLRDSTRVCPRCGRPAGDGEACAGCGLRLVDLDEIPTLAQYRATAAKPTPPPAPRAGPSPAAPVSEPAVRALLHPTEPSRLVLALVAAVGATVVVLAIMVASAGAGVLLQVLLFVGFVAGSIWIGVQIHKARLLGRSVRVTAETMPELQALIDEVRDTLGYRGRLEVYVTDKDVAPVVMSTLMGTRTLTLEGGLVAELLRGEKRPQLVFLIGRAVGALRAKHARLDLLVLFMQAANALKFVSPLVLPWYRATTYSGDQIGMVCCGDAGAALEGTRRLLVGKECAREIGTAAILPQAWLVQRRVLPRLAQLLSNEPHTTNRYSNLVCFTRFHDPDAWDRMRGRMDADEARLLDMIWARSPHRAHLDRVAR